MLQPRQVRDLIVDTDKKIKQLKEKHQLVLIKIKEKFKGLRAECGDGGINDIKKAEKEAIRDQEKIFKKALADLEEVFFNFKKQREEMLKDLELPSNVEV